MKKLIIFILILCFSFATLGLVACNEKEHVHTYSKEWSYDNDYHWHQATCEHSEYKKDKEEHVLSEWIIEDADCTTSGVRYKVCTVCGAKVIEEEISAYHQPSDWIIDVMPTCEENGSKHKECEICHQTLETEEIGKLGHKFKTYYPNNDQDDEHDGTETAVCEREGCNATDTRTIPGTMTGTEGEWDHIND